MLGLSLSLPSRRSPSGGGGGSPPVNDTPPVIAGETRASCQISCPGQVESSIDTFGFDIDSADGVKTVRINDTADVTVTIGPDVSDADVAEAVKVAMEAAFPELWTIERFLNSLTITDTSLGDRTAPVEAPALQFIVNSFTQTQEFPVGSTLTRTEGTWSDADSVAGNWQHDQGTGTWVNISGETGATYDIQAIYAGEDIRYNETATNGAGSTSEPSNELGPVWGPSSISGLLRWGAADALALSNDDPVSSYTDLSGNGNDYTGAGAARPTFKTGIVGALPAILFDGIANVLTAAITRAQPFTAFFTVSFTNASGYSLFFDTAASGFTYIGRKDPTAWAVFAGSEIHSGVVPEDQFVVVVVVCDGASTKLYVDGMEVVSGDPGANGLTGTRLGSANNSTAWFEGYLGEDGIYDSAISDADRIQLESYLMGRWTP